MTRVLHVIDAGCDETQLQVLATLCARLNADRAGTAHAAPVRPARNRGHVVCSIDGSMAVRAEQFLGEKVLRAERRARWLNWSPRLSAIVAETGAVVLHAWGLDAAAACGTISRRPPSIATLLNPDAAEDAARRLRSLPMPAAIVTGSQAIRSRLVTAGMTPERVIVIRGPADFGAINRARQADVRRQFVGDAKPVLLIHGPAAPGGGQYHGIWTAAVLRQVHPGLRAILPYDSSEGRRLRRFADSTRIPGLLITPDSPPVAADPRVSRRTRATPLTWPEMTACADVFLVPAADEVCIEPIATAMAAGLPVVGFAVRSVAELIGDGQNGLLVKPGDAPALAAQVLRVVEDDALRRRLTETARAQAYEIAGVRDFADNYGRLYENVLSGRAPGDGVRDTATAMVA